MECRVFLQEFSKNYDPDEALPLKVPSYYIRPNELKGQVVDWTFQYLQRQCPPCPSSLLVHIANKVTEKIIQLVPHFDFSEGNGIEPVHLMKQVVTTVNAMCLQLLRSDEVDAATNKQSDSPFHPFSVHAIRNTRRKMEDRHVIIQDMNSLFNLKTSTPVSYYAVFDGHAGTDAAFYAAAHLHYHLIQSEHFPSDIPQAFREAFTETDEQFTDLGEAQALKSGTTAVCCLIYGYDVYVAWLGDSQAIISRNGKVEELVNPHRPSRKDEVQRIEALGGSVFNWDGVYRVQGCIAVSRAIGDTQLKPYVSSDADVTSTKLDETADFLIVGCDGLWDCVGYDEAVGVVVQSCVDNDTTSQAAQSLVQLAKKTSSDNITVLVVFFKTLAEVQKIVPPVPAARASTSEDSFVKMQASGPQFEFPTDPAEIEKNMFNAFLRSQELKDDTFSGRPSSEMVSSVLAEDDSAFTNEDQTVYNGLQAPLVDLMRNKSDSELAVLLAASSVDDEEDQVEGPVAHEGLFPSPKLNQKIDSLTRTLAKKGRNIADEES